jgi:hypothetical protein
LQAHSVGPQPHHSHSSRWEDSQLQHTHMTHNSGRQEVKEQRASAAAPVGDVHSARVTVWRPQLLTVLVAQGCFAQCCCRMPDHTAAAAMHASLHLHPPSLALHTTSTSCQSLLQPQHSTARHSLYPQPCGEVQVMAGKAAANKQQQQWPWQGLRCSFKRFCAGLYSSSAIQRPFGPQACRFAQCCSALRATPEPHAKESATQLTVCSCRSSCARMWCVAVLPRLPVLILAC